jgi:hypothetical protein
VGSGLALVGVVAFGVGVGGCAAVAGVDQFSEGPCAGGDCDGSVMDALIGDSAPAGDAKPGADGGGGSDAATGSDAAKDGSPGQDGGGGNDGGCGPLDTPLNCTACGDACDVLHSNSATCNGATCVYASCHSGWSDCNTTQPNLDGCECNTPACCGSSCETTHSNGIGESFYDCVAQGTHDSTQAGEACGAYTGNQAQCSSSSCAGPGSNQVVCGTSGGICVCWDYSGSNVGHVYSSAGSTCYCPGSTDPSWN